MKKRTLTLVRLMTCLSLVVGFTIGWGADAALATVDCDPEFVIPEGNVFTVLPTGTDDTANLQCAFDAAVDAGAGSEVRLVAGAYHTGQIVVHEFHGSFSGAGADETAVYNLPNLYVTAVDYYLNPPSAENPWPMLFFFVGGDLSMSDLSLRITGDEPTTGWWYYGFGPIYELACAVTIMGTEANADVGHILVEGEAVADSMFGYNVINGVFPQGWMEWLGQPSPPLVGSFSVHHSTFRTLASGSPVYNLANASVVISHNDYEDVFYAMDGGDLTDSYLEFSHNRVEGGLFGMDLYNMNQMEDVGTALLIKNNRFEVEVAGVALEQTFGEGSQCLLLGNNVQSVGNIGIYLGPGISGCTVVGGANKTNVLDLGTGNILVGVNNMGSGVGPTIRTWMKMR